MRTNHDEQLARHTTLHVGGPARTFCEPETIDEMAEAVISADRLGLPLLVLGGGSNVLICDEGFEGVVVHTACAGIHVLPQRGPDARHAVLISCEAGVTWDDLVRQSVERGLSGAAALSGIPGCIGSACMQNVGAYGQEMASSLVSLHLLDRKTGNVRYVAASKIHPGYRSSVLRENLEESLRTGGRWFPTPRWVVLEATFGFARDPMTTVEHPQLAAALGVNVGEPQPSTLVRQEVLAVRSSKAMLEAEGESAQDHDRWSSGSFFTNPYLTVRDAESLPEDAPRYPAKGGVKTSAAWLIEHAGFGRGFGVHGEDSPARLSSKHTLALTNRGGATAADIVELARYVRDGVRKTFGIELESETVLVGVEL